MKNFILFLILTSSSTVFASECSITVQSNLSEKNYASAWGYLAERGFKTEPMLVGGGKMEITQSSEQASGSNILRSVHLKWTSSKGAMLMDETVQSYKLFGLLGKRWDSLLKRTIGKLPASCASVR